jgi:GDP-L-fucose synthase
MEKEAKIFIAGHSGMVGSAILRKLRLEGFNNIILRSSAELNLMNQQLVNDFFKDENPDYVFLSAAKVGGIQANNTFRAEFIYDNIMIEANVIHAAYVNKVKKLIFLGSSCIYPKDAPQPLREEYLLSGYLEPTNQPYAIAKIAGIELCRSYRLQYGCNFIAVMPCNLYGTNDNYNLENSHVLPALINKFVSAKSEQKANVNVWGTGRAKREFLHVDDFADACFFLMNNYNELEFVNVGTGIEISIQELAHKIASCINYNGSLEFDITKPDGTHRKLLDIKKINKLGWQSKISFDDGLKKTISEFEKIYKLNNY